MLSSTTLNHLAAAYEALNKWNVKDRLRKLEEEVKQNNSESQNRKRTMQELLDELAEEAEHSYFTSPPRPAPPPAQAPSRCEVLLDQPPTRSPDSLRS